MKKGYEVARLRSDLDRLQTLTFYSGKYPDLEPVRTCSAIDIVRGPGSLESNVRFQRSMIQDFVDRGTSGYTTGTLNDFDRFVVEDRDEWVTIQFRDTLSDLLRTLKVIVQALRGAEWDAKSTDIRMLLNKIGLVPSRVLRDIPADALALSAKYFFHFKNRK